MADEKIYDFQKQKMKDCKIEFLTSLNDLKFLLDFALYVGWIPWFFELAIAGAYTEVLYADKNYRCII